MAIIEIIENHTVWYDGDDEPTNISSETFIIDTDKVDAAIKEYGEGGEQWAFFYTKFIIDAARRGDRNYEASVKYSFTDTDDEYEKCKADDGAKVDHVMDVELNY